MLAQYYEIVIKDNNLAIVSKIDYETYKNLKNHFDYVYHSKNGETYPLHKNLDVCIDMLIVDDDHLWELLDDLKEQGFFDTIDFGWLDEYGYDPYLAF